MKEVKTLLPPVPEVINCLNEMLELANSERLRSIAIAGVLSNSESCNAWAGRHQPITLLGELLVVERELMDAQVDMRINSIEDD